MSCGGRHSAQQARRRVTRLACVCAHCDACFREALEAKFERKLAKLSQYRVEGKWVLRAPPASPADSAEAAEGEAPSQQLALYTGPPAPAPGDEAGVGVSEQPHAKRPSEVAWHTALAAPRYGAWSSDEKAALDSAIAAYADEHGLDSTDTSWLFHTRAAGRGPDATTRAVWLELARAVPHRSPAQVWGHATRRLRAADKGGAWTEEEKDRLKACVAPLSACAAPGVGRSLSVPICAQAGGGARHWLGRHRRRDGPAARGVPRQVRPACTHSLSLGLR